MVLPEVVPLKLLETRHEEWLTLHEVWETIQDLREGAPALLRKREKYLPRRPGELPELYNLRLDKFSYTPIFSTAIREYTAKLASAPVHLSGLPEGDSFWSEWLQRVDGGDLDHKEMLSHLFSTLLYYGRAFVAVDKPRLGVNPRNRLEEPSAMPYVVFYDPLLVTQWGDDWYLTRQVNTLQDPLAPPRTVVTWTYWLSEATETYQAEVKLASDGRILKVKVGDQWVNASLKSATVSQVSSVSHTLGRPAIVEARLDETEWVGAQAFLKQIQHLRVESAWTDSGTMAGIVQRIFTPPQATPAADPRVAYDEPDYSGMQFDGQHVLIGSDFKFVESSGDAVGNLSSQLDKIEHQIRSIASMGWQSVTTGALEQSGKSKEVDQALLQDSLKRFGQTVLRVDQAILDLVAATALRPERVRVSGLDSYATDTLGAMLEDAEVVQLLSDRLPPTALRIWYGKLTSLLAGSVSPEDMEAIQAELEETFSPSATLPPSGD